MGGCVRGKDSRHFNESMSTSCMKGRKHASVMYAAELAEVSFFVPVKFSSFQYQQACRTDRGGGGGQAGGCTCCDLLLICASAGCFTARARFGLVDTFSLWVRRVRVFNPLSFL